MGSLLEVGTGFHPELTGRENIFLNGAILGMKRAEILRRFDEIVAFAEVEKFIDTPVKHYSSGMYMRLAFAVAAHMEPEILIVDEVLAVGDAAFQKKCLGKMGDVAKHGRTVLFVSHNMNAVESLCRRVVLLADGVVIADGDPGSVIGEYHETDNALRAASVCTRVEITDDMRYGIADALKIVSVCVRDAFGEPAWRLPLRSSFSVDLTFEVLSDVEGVCLGVGIASLNGSRVLTTHHTDTGAGLVSLGRGIYTVSTTIDAPLKPGWYAVDVGAVDGGPGGGQLDYIPSAVSIEVAGSSRNEGLLEIEAKWSRIKRHSKTEVLSA